MGLLRNTVVDWIGNFSSFGWTPYIIVMATKLRGVFRLDQAAPRNFSTIENTGGLTIARESLGALS